MTPEQLKASILQLAMQGKLVEQRPEEGTGEELLSLIRGEKARLIKEGKIKKEKPLAEIAEDEIPFEIPETWRWARLSFAFDMFTGDSIPQSEKDKKYSKVSVDCGLPYIGTKDVGFDHSVNYFNGIRIPDDELESFEIARSGETLMCIEGGSAGKKIAVLSEEVCFGNKLMCFRPWCVSLPILYWFLQSDAFLSQFKASLTGIIAGISKKNIEGLILPLPPLEEQKRIVAKIEELMPLVERYAQAYERLQALNERFPADLEKSVLQLAMRGKLVEQRPEEGTGEELLSLIREEKARLVKEGKLKKEKALPEIAQDEIPFEIPETWRWARLGVITFNRGQKTPEGPFSYIDIGSIDNQRQKLSKQESVLEAKDAPTRARRIVKKGDIVYSTVRPYLHNMAIIDKDFSAEPIASTGFAVLACPKGVFNRYLFYYLLSPWFDLYANSNENSKGMAYPAINDERLQNAIIPIPPLEEQKRIVAKIEELMPLCRPLAGNCA